MNPVTAETVRGNVSVRLGHEEAGSNSGYVATVLGGGRQLGYNRAVNEISRAFHNIWSRCMNVSIGACRSLRTSVPITDGLPSVKMLVGTFNKSLNNCKTYRENR